MSASLARRATIQQLVAVYQEQCERVRKAFAEIADAETTLRAAFLTESIYISAEYQRFRGGEWDNPDVAIKRLRRPTWAAIIERLELRRVMSASRWAECQRWLWSDDLPDITAESVTDFVSTWVESIDEMWQEAVQEAFEYLRPRRSKHKTNSELEIPPKVILVNVVEHLPFSVRLRDGDSAQIANVERVFLGLDGNGQVMPGYYAELEKAICDAATAGSSARLPYDEAAFDRETPYFRVRVYGNGNVHLWFKRLDLLAKLNAIAGGKRLRPARVA